MDLLPARLRGCHVVRVVYVRVLLSHNAVRVGGVLPRALLPVCRVAVLVAVQGSATGAGTVGGGHHAVAAFGRVADVRRGRQGGEVVARFVHLIRVHARGVDSDGFSRRLHLVAAGAVDGGCRRVVERLRKLHLRAQGSAVLHDGWRGSIGEEG